MGEMNREITNVLSTGLDLYSCVICLFMIFSMGRNIKQRKASIYFILVCTTVLIFNISDISNWMFEGTSPAWHVPALHILTFIYYLCVPFAFLFILRYVEEYLKPYRISKIFFTISHIISILYAIGLILSPIMGFYYQITSDNYYTRGRFNFVSTIFYGLFYLSSVITILYNYKYFSRKALFSFLSFSLLPILMNIIQLNFYGLSLVNSGMTISILLIFMNSHKDLEERYEKTEKEVFEQEKKLITFQEHTIHSLADLVENRDTQTGYHAKRTSIYVNLLANQLKNDGYYTEILTDEYISKMIKSAPMHDVGKIVISDTILKKPGPLTSQEFEIIKTHTTEGARILTDIIGFSGDREYMKVSVDMAQYHHEWWDGTGYPFGLKENDIPLCARIMAVADVFDALVFERIYKEPLPIPEAFAIIKKESGTHFDPIIVEEFFKTKEEILRIITTYRD